MSKRLKISEKSPILTQECQFCARKAGKWGSRSQKAHKNADFVLGGPHRRARSSSAEHGTSTERPSAAGNNHPKRNKTAWNEAQRPEAQRNATSTQRNRNTTATQHNTRNATASATPRNRHATAQWGTTKKETTFRVVSFKNWRLPTLPHGSAVPSAQVSLTSLFGMGRGGSSPLLPP